MSDYIPLCTFCRKHAELFLGGPVDPWHVAPLCVRCHSALMELSRRLGPMRSFVAAEVPPDTQLLVFPDELPAWQPIIRARAEAVAEAESLIQERKSP